MAELIVKKRVKNAILYDGGIIKLENVRLSYPHLSKPYAGKPKNENDKPQTPKYGVVSMLPKTTHLDAKNLVRDAVEELLKANDNATVSKEKWCLKNGDDHENESYKGHWILSAREERRPGVRDKRGGLVTEPEKVADLIYGGAWGHVLIRLWYQDGKKGGAGYGKRVNAGLQGVQFIKDDAPFGEGRVNDEAAWGDESGSSGGSDGFSSDDDI